MAHRPKRDCHQSTLDDQEGINCLENIPFPSRCGEVLLTMFASLTAERHLFVRAKCPFSRLSRQWSVIGASKACLLLFRLNLIMKRKKEYLPNHLFLSINLELLTSETGECHSSGRRPQSRQQQTQSPGVTCNLRRRKHLTVEANRNQRHERQFERDLTRAEAINSIKISQTFALCVRCDSEACFVAKSLRPLAMARED